MAARLEEPGDTQRKKETMESWAGNWRYDDMWASDGDTRIWGEAIRQRQHDKAEMD